MFATNAQINESGQGAAVERCPAPAQTQRGAERGRVDPVARVRSVIAPGLSLPRGGGPTQEASADHRGDSARHAQAAPDHGTGAARVRTKQWPEQAACKTRF